MRTTLLAVIVMALLAMDAMAGPVELVDPSTGETFAYRPSFAKTPEPHRPSRKFFDVGEQKWRTIKASRAEMAERHRMHYARAHVRFMSAEPAGTIVVDTLSRHLYFTLGDGTAIRYGIGVGRTGFTWAGVERVTRKAEWPDWTPPPEMLERQPELPTFMPGGPQNPMGAAALYLGSTLYRIHGTTEDHTIGYAVSSGCIRMLNEDVQDLYARATLGTRVIVLGPNSDRNGLIAAISAM
ncbi:MAG: L,D-transpeptidase [Pseudomonadota bacterium]